MPRASGQRLRAEARFVLARPLAYRQQAAVLEALLRCFAQGIEVTGIVQASSYFLGLPPLTWPEATAFLQEVGAQLRQGLGLAPTFGLADGKFPAERAAASGVPHRLRRVLPGTEATRAPLVVANSCTISEMPSCVLLSLSITFCSSGGLPVGRAGAARAPDNPRRNAW